MEKKYFFKPSRIALNIKKLAVEEKKYNTKMSHMM